jgi:hypothetical protein
MVTIKEKTENNKCWQGCGDVKTLALSWWECEMAQLLWKTVWWFL